MGTASSTTNSGVINSSSSLSPDHAKKSDSTAAKTDAQLDVNKISVPPPQMKTRSTIMRANIVAPVIIKNCNEEFQQVFDFKEPIVYGRMSDNTKEHPLIKGQYFVVKDVQEGDDRLFTNKVFLAPNLRKTAANYPIYGMGQPTKDGLTNFIEGLKTSAEAAQMVLVFNLRNDPVLYVKDGEFDMSPYSLQHIDKVPRVWGSTRDMGDEALNSIPTQREAKLLEDMEVEIRKEILDLAAYEGGQKFYFYNDPQTPGNEPLMLKVAYEDDVAVTQEIFSRLTFTNSNIRYKRICWPRAGIPSPTDVDDFISMFSNLYGNMNGSAKRLPTVLFTSHDGVHRSTLGMIMSLLIYMHKQPPDAQIAYDDVSSDDDDERLLEKGEFHVVRNLTDYLPSGRACKAEVDWAIEECSEVLNLRAVLIDSVHRLDELVHSGNNQMSEARESCLVQMEIYLFLICFNSYVKQSFERMFSEKYSYWLSRQSSIAAILKNIDQSELRAPFSLLQNKTRFLVDDNYIGLDVLSSHMDVNVSNFRRVPGLPIYGMAQPTKEGLICLSKHLMGKKLGHPKIVWVNLREDLVVECGGATYTWREAGQLSQSINLSGVSGEEIEAKEEELKEYLQDMGSLSVYSDVEQKPQVAELSPCLTCVDLYTEVVSQSINMTYYRMPMNDDGAPYEQIFEQIVTLVKTAEEIHNDEDGPAFLFQCRNGRGRTTMAMAIAGLVVCHIRGFPYGTKPGEEERVSLPYANYTQGHYKAVQEVVRLIPNGHQVKREVDFVLNQCSDTMTPMLYHIREIIFVTFNKMKKATDETEQDELRCLSLNYLQRYIYLILFNAYLHCERKNQWHVPFSKWMSEVAARAGMCTMLDNLSFSDIEQQLQPDQPVQPQTLITPKGQKLTMYPRWWTWWRSANIPIRGNFV